MINNCKFIVLDFETTALDPKFNQPVSIGAVMIDPRKLAVCEQGTFYSTISIIPDADVTKYNLVPVEQKAMDTHGIPMGEIMGSPPLKKVWGDFTNWVKFHTTKNDEWCAPIFCGHNREYDRIIAERIQNGHLGGQVVLSGKLLGKTKLKKAKNEELGEEYRRLIQYEEPWGYGPNTLFHPALGLDTYQLAFSLFENCREPHRLSLSSLRDFLGFSVDGAHNALVDVLYSAEILVRYLKLMRNVYRDTDFYNDGEYHLPIKQLLPKDKNKTKKEEVEECPF